VVNNDQEALAAIRRFLSYLPSHSNETPAVLPCEAEDRPDSSGPESIVPVERSKTYDMRKLLATLVDRDSLFPLKDRFGRSVVTALARLEGATIGIVASNPQFKGGALDADACRKATGFIALCDSFNIPLVFLVDTPGFLVGIEGEKRSAPAHIMNMIHAVQLCSVPKLSVIVRKSFGQAYLNFGGGRNSDQSAAWCTADVSFVDPGVAVSVVHDVTREADPERYDRLRAEFSKDTSAFALAGAMGTHEVIAPRETRRFLVEALGAQQRAMNKGIGRHEMSTWPTYF
jgi:acetyl-CoA carboxylase carboxyltransferase component